MNKLIKHKQEDRAKIFFSSDWHNFHDPKWPIPIWKMRGYSSPQESADDVIAKINSRVGVDDFLYYCGDSFLNATDEQVLEWFGKINCMNIRYIFGNHSSNTYRIYKQQVKEQYGLDDQEVYPIRLMSGDKFLNVMFLGNYQEIQVGKQKIVLSHYPIHSFNGMNHSAWCITGHSHNNDPTRNPDYPLGKVLDCGWDWKKDIWSFGEIEDIMSTKEILQEGHH